MTDSGKVVYMDDYLPHKVSKVVCLNCLKMWVSVRPISTKLSDLRCPQCGLMGYAIETGEELDFDGVVQ